VVAENLQIHYAEELAADGLVPTAEEYEETRDYILYQTEKADASIRRNGVIQTVIVISAMLIMFNVYSIIHKRERQMEMEKLLAEEVSRAKTSFLSNMSHEIRTPMNAIIGLDNIALQNTELSPKTREQLEKIGASAKHLLGLINDILDMSRIESGRMALKNEEFSFSELLDPISVMISGQCQDKGLTYECEIIGHVDPYYVGDAMKLRQVLINILGNAVKFTNPPGTVTLIVEQTVYPAGHMMTDTLDCDLIDERGNAKGEGISQYQYLFPLKTIQLHQGDSLHLSVHHNMKREILPGVTSVGVKLSKKE
jgi:signal transduction histidine kinase